MATYRTFETPEEIFALNPAPHIDDVVVFEAGESPELTGLCLYGWDEFDEVASLLENPKYAVFD